MNHMESALGQKFGKKAAKSSTKLASGESPKAEQRSSEKKDQVQELTQYTNWEDMGLGDNLLRGIYAKGWDNPTYIQSMAIKPMMKGRDTLAQAQSGMGKTGAFTVGTLHHITDDAHVQAIILSPTRELAYQTHLISCELSRVMVEKGTMTEPQLVTGGMKVRQMIYDLQNNDPAVIVATPGRLLHMIEKGYLDVSKCRTAVLDECDELLSRGFKEQIYEIFQYLSKDAQIGCFSATMPKEVVDLTKKFMRPNFAYVLKPAKELTLDGIKQFWVEVKEDQKADCLLDLFETLTISQSMIFINSKAKIDQVAEYLRQNDFAVGVIHAGLDKEARRLAMERFRKGLDRVMLCSDVVSRGVDIAGVSIVVNYDMPRASQYDNGWKDNYLHRIGRSGRHGKKGVSINFLTNEDDVWIQKQLEEHYGCEVEEMPNDVDKYLGG